MVAMSRDQATIQSFDAPVDVSMRVEILVAENCPLEEAAIDMVGAAAAQVGVIPELHLVEISDATRALQHRFSGSPTIRVDGKDIDPPPTEANWFACWRLPEAARMKHAFQAAVRT
jgi:hypothetical protein